MQGDIFNQKSVGWNKHVGKIFNKKYVGWNKHVGEIFDIVAIR